ncbi:DUF6161 domain-containing protein [Ensifer sp. LBL]|uniref:DUF6161 domain-containing protein n=1 Tax=Ensifer sp. LBL TaxID=2991056 RepID=UPI003D1E6BB6
MTQEEVSRITTEQMRAISSVLRLNQFVFSSEHAEAAAKNIASEQLDLHIELCQQISALGAFDNDETGTSGTLIAFRDGYVRPLAEQAKPFSYEDQENKRTFIVESGIPVLMRSEVEEVLRKLIGNTPVNRVRPRFYAECVAFYIQEYQERTSWSGPPVQISDASYFGQVYFAMRAKRELFKAQEEARAQEAAEYSAAERYLTGIRTEIATQKLEVNAVSGRIAEMVDKLTGIQNEIEAAQSHFANSIEQTQQTIIENDAKAQNAHDAMMEQMRLKETDKLWRNEGHKAAKHYYWSLGGLVLLLAALPILAITLFKTDLLAYIQQIEANIEAATKGSAGVAPVGAAIGRIFLLTVPIAFFIWAVKLLVRYNMRSMLVMDDANHRVAILNTYLFLVKQEVAKVEDRGALLEAMFRRMPGHGPETIDPPSLPDIMRYGQTVGQAGK